MAPCSSTWEVVGGIGSGGIVVRLAKDLASPQVGQRLSIGATVRELKYDEKTGRLRYERLTGTGPLTGWVSTRVKDREILVRAGDTPRAPTYEVSPDARPRPRVAAEAEAPVVGTPPGSAQAPRCQRRSLGRGRQDPVHFDASKLCVPPLCEQQLSECGSSTAEGTASDDSEGSASPRPGARAGAWLGPAPKRGAPVQLASTGVVPSSLSFTPRPQPLFGKPGASCDVPAVLDSRPVPAEPQQDVVFRWNQLLASRESAQEQAAGMPRPATSPLGWQELRPSASLLMDVLRGSGEGPRPGSDCAETCGEPAPSGPGCVGLGQRYSFGDGSEATELRLCPECGLPVGDWGYMSDDGRKHFLHGECKAQILLHNMREEERLHREERAAQKRSCRAEYGIGWSMDQIPRNVAPARQLQCRPAPRHLCGLELDEVLRAARVVPTTDPSAAVNLEYLALALQVRRCEGTEPRFSLEPLDEPEGSSRSAPSGMQAKRFEPQWLAGTSVGDVLFQADYHLKELCMGEYMQPVVGMKSCMDSPDIGHGPEWCARAWFVVNSADMWLSEANVLIPHVKMGVEARELVKGPNGFEDAVITRADHPMVKFAERFTHYFDLIAERKSVIFYLRQLARASVIAKFLIEGNVGLQEEWFSLSGAVQDACAVEIPQLWSEQYVSRIQVKDGKILGGLAGGIKTRMRGVYGGVQFGLDRFSVLNNPTLMRSVIEAARPKELPMGVPSVGVPGRAARPLRQVATKMVVANYAPEDTLAKAMEMAESLLLPSALQGLQGVDLNLDSFDMSVATPAGKGRAGGSWCSGELDPAALLGSAFWPHVDGDVSPVFEGADRAMLRAVFNPSMCDRREEGDLFVPPEARPDYVQSLRALVGEEERVKSMRKDHFLSSQFSSDGAGPLFPSSWTSQLGVVREQGPGARPRGACPLDDPRRPSQSEALGLELALRRAAPLFDKTSEDGSRFCIYHVGDLEVRTIQEMDSEENIGAVFSSRLPRAASADQGIWGGEKVVKIMDYVESAERAATAAQIGCPVAGEPPMERVAAAGQASGDECPAAVQGAPMPLPFRRFTLLETKDKNVIMSERLEGGMETWVENPTDLDARISMAKVVRWADSRNASINVRDVRSVLACRLLSTS